MNAKIEEFLYSIKSEKTKTLYQYYIRYFTKFAKMEIQYLLTLPTDKIQKIIIDYVIHMRESKLAYSSIKTRVSPLYTFLELNDISVNKRKIERFFGEQKRTVKDQAYTNEDIQRMVSMASFRTKLMILVFSSTGMRREAFLELRLKHLHKIPELDIYRFTIYENSREEHHTYCTPECASVIDQYLKYREESGESLTPNSYLFRNSFNPNNPRSIKDVRKITGQDLTTILGNLLENTGQRKIKHGSKYERHEKSMFHAFRKFFATTLANANVNQLVKELLLGHSVGLDNSYFRPNEQTMLAEYAKAINALTIDPANRLRREVKILEERQDEIELMKLKHEKDKQEMDKKLNRIITAIQRNPKLVRIKPQVLKRKIH
jgi:integrase